MSKWHVTTAGQPASTKETIHFAKGKIRKLQEEIGERTEEIAVWKRVLDELKPCEECEGEGSFRVFIAQDETEFQECKNCKGKGVLS